MIAKSYGSLIYNYSVPLQSVPITTKVVSLNPVHGNATLYDKVCHDIAEILFKDGIKHHKPNQIIYQQICVVME
jgi:hypothetical protein